MVEGVVGQDGDRLLIRLDPGGPVELTGLTESFGALARIYERHYGIEGPEGGTPRLYVTRLASGSILAEIVPFTVFMGVVIGGMAAAVTVGDFAKRLNDGLRAFAGIKDRASPVLVAPAQDAADLKAFVQPLTGRADAALGITHARFHSLTKDREIIAEYEFKSAEIDRAVVNIDHALDLIEATPERSSKPHNEVMLFFDSASRGIGKEKGRTRDYAIVPDVSKRPLPVYFRTSVSGNLKDVMVRGSTNPLADVAYVVDLHAQMIGGEPKGYIVTNIHRTIPLEPSSDEEDASPSA
jgi:hypothetical protein